MSWFSRPAPAPAPARGISKLSMIGLAAVVLFVAGLVLFGRGATSVSPDSHSVTVTAPQAPSITLPNVDNATQAELAVLGSGTGWDGAMKSLSLWAADRLLWLAVPGLILAVVLWAVPFIPDEWGWRLGIGCAVLIVVGLFAPLAIVLLQGGVDARDAVVVQHLPSPPPAVR